MKILIVEDTDDSRVLLEEYLSSVGYDVASASNGNEALKCIDKSKFDLIISDILMPEMDGFEFCRKVKAKVEISSIPFIFYTATYTEEADKMLALSLGAQYFVVKPETPEKLLDIIKRVMGGEDMAMDMVSQPDFDDAHTRVVSAKLDKKIRELEIERELLNRKELYLRFVMDAVPMLISHVDNDMRYKYVNKAYEDWHKLDRSQVVGHKVRDVVGDDVWDGIRLYIQHALQGEMVEYETEITYKTGETKNIWVRYVPNITDSGEQDGFVALINDVTEQRRLQHEQTDLRRQLFQSQKMEAIGQMVSGVAHDFNNILSSMLGFTELVQMVVDDSEIKIQEYLKEVVLAGDKGKQLIEQMLIYSRGGSQKQELLYLNSAVPDTFSIISKLLPATIELDIDMDASDYYAKINMVQLQQLIMNLSINARDAMNGNGNVTISIDNRELVEEVCQSCCQRFSGDYVALRVKDTGPGIDEKCIENLFNPFYTTKEVGKGSGMGLSVVHGVTHENGGHILVKSELGIGVEFIILLPMPDVMLEESNCTSAASQH